MGYLFHYPSRMSGIPPVAGYLVYPHMDNSRRTTGLWQVENCLERGYEKCGTRVTSPQVSNAPGVVTMNEIIYKPIGVIRSPHMELEGMPIQPSGAEGVRGTIELNPDFGPGLKDLDGFSYVMLFYHFHRSYGYSLETRTFLDETPHGVFSTRIPRRPNAIGLSVVKVIEVRGNVVEIEDVDILDGTPLLDIKPFVPQFDNRATGKIGWIADKISGIRTARSDDRFK